MALAWSCYIFSSVKRTSPKHKRFKPLGRDRKLWKRIWWSIYVRDRHAATALGRPMRIHDDDCDVEMLDESDFDDDIDDERLYGISKRELAQYVIQMAKLSVICEFSGPPKFCGPRVDIRKVGSILKNAFPLSDDNVDLVRNSLMGELVAWLSQLPAEMQYNGIGAGSGVKFWSSMLHVAYKYNSSTINFRQHCLLYHSNYVILLDRPKYAKSSALEGNIVEETLFTAANKITRAIDDLLSERKGRCAPLHV